MDTLSQKLLLAKLRELANELEGKRSIEKVRKVGAKIYPILQQVDIQFAAQFYQSLHHFNLGLSGYTLEPSFQVMRSMVNAAIHKLELAVELAGEVSSPRYYAPNSQFDIQVDLARVLQQAKKKIWIVDPYSDENVLIELTATPVSEIKILTKRVNDLFARRIIAFQEQYPDKKLLVRTSDKSHDRFYILDSEAVWTLGTSQRGVGKKATVLTKFDSERGTLVINDLQSWWNASNNQIRTKSSLA